MRAFRVRFCVVLLILACKSTHAQIDFWQPTNGPYGGNVSGLGMNSTQHLFAIESDGRVFRSTDQGAHWMIVSKVPQGQINTFLLAPSGFIFAGTMYGIFRSTDQGGHWTQINSGLTRTEIYNLACDAGGRLYAQSYFGGVYSSTNNGDLWTPLGLIYVQSLFVTSTGEVFAGTSSTIYRYSGSGWSPLGLSNVSVNSIGVNFLGHIFVATYFSSGSILLSTDNGAHWAQRSTGIPQYASVSSLFINALGNLFVLAYDGRSTTYLSTNNGTSWTVLDLPPTGRFTETTTGNMYAGGNGVHRSTNNGVGWTQTRYTALPVRSMAVTTTNSIFASTYRGLYRSTNSGETWQPLDSGYDRLLASNKTGDLFSASYTVHRSTDDGLTWNLTNTQWESARAMGLAISSTGVIYASTNRDISPCPCTVGLFRSNNNGNNWSNLFVDSVARFVNAIGIHPQSEELYVSSWNTVYRSTNEGNVWSLRLATPSTVRAINVTAGGIVLVGTDSGRVFRSTDQGSSWSSIVLTTTPIVSIVTARETTTYASTANGVFRSTNGGETWTQLNGGLLSPEVLSLAIDSAGYLYAGTDGLGVFRSRLSTAIEDDELEQSIGTFRLEQNYPNPFNPTTEIRYQTSEVSRVVLKVFDLLGREVATLVNEVQGAGFKFVKFHANDLSSGVYFYQLRASGFVQTRKLILAK